MINVGNSDIQQATVGSQEVANIYVGNSLVYSNQPPISFNWQARFNLSVDGASNDVIQGFNVLRPVSPIAASTVFDNFVDTNGNSLTGITITMNDANVVAEASTGASTPDPILYNQRWRNNGGYNLVFSGLDNTKRYTLQCLTYEAGTEGAVITNIAYVLTNLQVISSIARDSSLPVPTSYDFSDVNWVRHDEILPTDGGFRYRVTRSGTTAMAVIQSFILTEYDIVVNGNQEFHYAGQTDSPLPFISYEPTDVSTPKPAFIYLHGSGERGNGGTVQLPNAMKFGPNNSVRAGTFHQDAYAFTPQITTSAYWSGNVEALDNFVDYLLANYSIDPNHVYIIAFSDGCVGLGCLITRTQGAKITAALSIGYDPAYTEGQPRGDIDYNEVAKLPCWTFGNRDDTVTDINDTITGVQTINGINPGICKLTVFNNSTHEICSKIINGTGMGTMIDPAYDPFDQNVYDWLLTHSL